MEDSDRKMVSGKQIETGATESQGWRKKGRFTPRAPRKGKQLPLGNTATAWVHLFHPCRRWAPLYYCSFTGFLQARSIQKPMPWAPAGPLVPILGEPVSFLGTLGPPRAQIGEASLLSVPTPPSGTSWRLLCYYPSLHLWIVLDSFWSFSLSPFRMGLGAQGGWEPFWVETVFYTLNMPFTLLQAGIIWAAHTFQ